MEIKEGLLTNGQIQQKQIVGHGGDCLNFPALCAYSMLCMYFCFYQNL